MAAEPAPHLAAIHSPTVEEGFDAVGELVPLAARRGIVRQPRDGEECVVAFGNDVRAEARPPDLHERRIFTARRLDLLDAGVNREERSSRHAVLQSGPRGEPQRLRARGEPLVQATDASSKREDLRARQIEPTLGHRDQPLT